MTALLAPPYPILVMNGPNLGRIGERKPDVYGTAGLADIPDMLRGLMGEKADEVALHFFQSNGEGALIDRLEAARDEGVGGVVLNAGAYSHTSLALADALEWLGLAVVEVHISNVWARAEKIRHASLISPHVVGVVAGFGVFGYALAVQALHARIASAAR